MVALLLGALFLLRPGSRAAPPVTVLGGDVAALRDAFNRGAGRVRLLLLVDPT